MPGFRQPVGGPARREPRFVYKQNPCCLFPGHTDASTSFSCPKMKPQDPLSPDLRLGNHLLSRNLVDPTVVKDHAK